MPPDNPPLPPSPGEIDDLKRKIDELKTGRETDRETISKLEARLAALEKPKDKAKDESTLMDLFNGAT